MVGVSVTGTPPPPLTLPPDCGTVAATCWTAACGVVVGVSVTETTFLLPLPAACGTAAAACWTTTACGVVVGVSVTGTAFLLPLPAACGVVVACWTAAACGVVVGVPVTETPPPPLTLLATF